MVRTLYSRKSLVIERNMDFVKEPSTQGNTDINTRIGVAQRSTLVKGTDTMCLRIAALHHEQIQGQGK